MTPHVARDSFRAASAHIHTPFANCTGTERRKQIIKPGAIALRCIKTVDPVYFGQVYIGWPCAMRVDGTGTAETFMVSANGRAVRKEAHLFEPVNPRHRRLFPHLLTRVELNSSRDWYTALREKCRADSDRIAAETGMPMPAAPAPSPFRDWLKANCLTGVETAGKPYAFLSTLYDDYAAYVRARNIEQMAPAAFRQALEAYGHRTSFRHDGRSSGICLRSQVDVRR